MKSIVPILTLFCILLANPTWASPSAFVVSRDLLDIDELETELHQRSKAKEEVKESSLNPESTSMRIKGLIDNVDTMTNKCMKFLYVLKSYLSYYEDKNAEQLLESINIKPKFTTFIPNHFITKFPTLKDAGTIASLRRKKVNRSRRLMDNLEEEKFNRPELHTYGDIDAKESNFDKLELN